LFLRQLISASVGKVLFIHQLMH